MKLFSEVNDQNTLNLAAANVVFTFNPSAALPL
jgi:hypothetical protein